MSIQLDLLERDLSEQLYSTRGWIGRLQRKLDRIERMQELILDYRKRIDHRENTVKIVQLDLYK